MHYTIKAPIKWYLKPFEQKAFIQALMIAVEENNAQEMVPPVW